MINIGSVEHPLKFDGDKQQKHVSQQSTINNISTLHQEQIATEVHHLLQLTKQSIKAKPQPVEVHMG